MKKCPQCNCSYSDETLSLCPEDGALLSASYNPQETNTPSVTEQTQDRSVRWYIYPLGFVVGWIIHFLLIKLLYLVPQAIGNPAMQEFAGNLFGEKAKIYGSVMIPRITITLIAACAVAMILGFIWSRAGWKWGVFVAIFDLILTARLISIPLPKDD